MCGEQSSQRDTPEQPPAISGLVAPVWAMLAMAASVSLVLANSFAGRLLAK